MPEGKLSVWNRREIWFAFNVDSSKGVSKVKFQQSSNFTLPTTLPMEPKLDLIPLSLHLCRALAENFPPDLLHSPPIQSYS